VRVLAERREGPDYRDVAVTDELDFGVITENYGRLGLRAATEMHNQGRSGLGQLGTSPGWARVG
jgi:hypothetical protein